MMEKKATLIMLPNPILVGRELSKEAQTTPHFQDFDKRYFEILANIECSPYLDLSLIAQRIGWVDVERLADKFFESWSLGDRKQSSYELFRKVYEFSQFINEKKFSEKDLYGLLKLIGQKGYYVECDGTVYANAFDGGDVVDVVKEYSESLSKPKEYDVECIQEGNTIKVTKIL